MFLLAGILWVGLGSIPLILAFRKRSEPDARGRFVRGSVVLALDLLVLIAVNVYFGLATEYWWFAAAGFGQRFWTEYSVRLLLFAIGAVLGAIVFGFGLRSVVDTAHALARKIVFAAGLVVGGVILGLIANALWQPLLVFINRMASGTVDPIFGLDTTFYLFALPLAQAIRAQLITALVAYVLVGAVVISVTQPELRQGLGPVGLLARDRRVRAQVEGVAGVFVLLIAVGNALAIPELMYSGQGAVTGVGWLEANVLVPVNAISAVVLLLVGLLLVAATVGEGLLFRLLAVRRVEGADETGEEPGPGPSGGTEEGGGAGEIRLTSRSWVVPAIIVGGLFVIGSIVPGLIRSLVLDPNEITLESEYIPYHVNFTRDAYAIDQENVEETEYPVGRNITSDVLDANEATIDNVRLWDWRALQSNLEEQQEIRLYYEFHDVDIDRYTYDGERRQMMLSVRELEKSNLDQASQTWVSRHFKYTHGYGLVALPVTAFTSQGGPDLTVRNIPPESESARFDLTRPQVYYGERTSDHVYVKTTQQEFDYPSGDQNVYTDYTGEGGVPVGGLLRRLAFAWRIDGYRQLFSSYFTPESRVMFRRDIVERARIVAPFLRYDRDPYPVVTEDGRIVYIIDAYTTSRAYPYSQPYTGMLDGFRGVNYIRNSVKVAVDAYDGSMDFYVVTPDDPIVSAFERTFPELFTPIEEMPSDLKAHIRYPADLLTVQAELYSTYHMTDTQVFYQREDVWEFANERYRGGSQPVEPYYVMLKYPGEQEVEFILMLPFTPANKNVMNAWMAGRSDYERYGTLTVYTLPKGVEVIGPRQIEARIDQNAEMSRSLSLWSQRGSEVIRGNLLAIPLFADDLLYILYVEPIFLQAEGAALPELRRVVLGDQRRVVWDPGLATARRRLLGELPATPGGVSPEGEEEATAAEATAAAAGAEAAAAEPEAAAGPEETQPSAAAIPSGQLVEQANQAFADYRDAVAEGRYEDAGTALERLETLLGRLEGER